MLIEWTKTGEITLYDNPDDSEGKRVKVTKGKTQKVSILEAKEEQENPDMIFEDGSYAFGIDTESFTIIGG